MKTTLFAPFALVFATLGLAACGSHQQPAAKHDAGPAKGLSVSDGRLVLPAVHGNPGALYFTVHNDSAGKETLVSADVEGAKMAMLHEMSMAGGHTNMQEVSSMDVAPGAELVFAPGGRHVMAMDLSDTLKPGGTTNATLAFASGEKATFPAEILAAGNAR